MQLVTFTLEGYRRFLEPTSVKLHADMVALVGPNEAGKSSVLKALTHLNSDTPFAENEKPRRSTAQPHLKWQLQLESDDVRALDSISEASKVERVTIEKGSDGSREWSFSPEIERDLSARRALLASLRRGNQAVEKATAEYGLDLDYDRLRTVLDSEDDFDSEIIELTAFADRLASVWSTVPAGEISASLEKRWQEIEGRLRSLIEIEGREHPADLAIAVLEGRLPQIRFFDVADRDLRREYDLGEVSSNPPPALAHLARIAELDLAAFYGEISSGRIHDASTRRNQANKKLIEIFRSWNQEEIALQVEYQGTLLHVQVTTPSDEGLSSLDDRSDGMRWFATLLAFTYGSGNRPILLADEIETHLHYDAQADLVEVLASQSLTSKVIYTTHSFGCLPYDIGNGVKVVKQTGLGTSELENGFWNSGSGFSPLLVSMGAAAVSFTPTRKALVGEGAAEAIALPTLLRQATGRSKLDFQVAPGLASVAASDVPNLETEAGQVAYIVDGDAGGGRIKKKLMQTVDESRIVMLIDLKGGLPMETEDLFDPLIYAQAVAKELALWNGPGPYPEEKFYPTQMRTKALESWCRKAKISPPDKGAVAQRVVNASASKTIYDKSRKRYIIQLLAQIEAALLVSVNNPPLPES